MRIVFIALPRVTFKWGRVDLSTLELALKWAGMRIIYVDIRMATCQTNGSDNTVGNFRVRPALVNSAILSLFTRF